MRRVELRRHSLRGPSGDLSEEGEALARKTAATAAIPYDAFFSSPARRAQQTASAFGGVDVRVDPRLGLLPGADLAPYDGRARALMERREIGLLAAYVALPEVHPTLRKKGEEVLEAIREIGAALPDGGCALAISHGGTIEPAALIALGGEFDLDAIGGDLAECEGVRFDLEDGRVVSVEVIRL